MGERNFGAPAATAARELRVTKKKVELWREGASTCHSTDCCLQHEEGRETDRERGVPDNSPCLRQLARVTTVRESAGLRLLADRKLEQSSAMPRFLLVSFWESVCDQSVDNTRASSCRVVFLHQDVSWDAAEE